MIRIIGCEDQEMDRWHRTFRCDICTRNGEKIKRNSPECHYKMLNWNEPPKVLVLSPYYPQKYEFKGGK